MVLSALGIGRAYLVRSADTPAKPGGAVSEEITAALVVLGGFAAAPKRPKEMRTAKMRHLGNFLRQPR